MNSKRPSSRLQFGCLLLLSGVLVLGIVQWSVLPLLIQNAPAADSTVLEISGGHASKFAAPFKGLFVDGLNPCLVQSRITVWRIASRLVRLQDAPFSRQDDFSLSHHPLRAPPSA